MGASKTNQYTEQELKKALIARAFAHPARIKIYKLLKKESLARNKELSEWLGLSVSTVHTHIQKMMQADIVSSEFRQNDNFFFIKKNQMNIFDFKRTSN